MRRRPDTTRSSRTRGEFRLQAVGRQPLYDGGARRAAVARAEAGVDAAAGRYRIEEKDLILEVTSRYRRVPRGGGGSLGAAERDLPPRDLPDEPEEPAGLGPGRRGGPDQDGGPARLRGGEHSRGRETGRRGADHARRAHGPRARRSARARARSRSRSRSRGAGGAHRLGERAGNRRRGRRGAGRGCLPWRARASEWRPHLALSADVGFWGSDTSRWIPADLKAMDPNANFADRVRRDAGYSFSLTFSWPIFDLGAIRARVAQADLELQQAKQKIVAARSDARVNGERGARGGREPRAGDRAPAKDSAGSEGRLPRRGEPVPGRSGHGARGPRRVFRRGRRRGAPVRRDLALPHRAGARRPLGPAMKARRIAAVLLVAAACRGGGEPKEKDAPAPRARPRPRRRPPSASRAVAHATLPLMVSAPGQDHRAGAAESARAFRGDAHGAATWPTVTPSREARRSGRSWPGRARRRFRARAKCCARRPPRPNGATRNAPSRWQRRTSSAGP